MGNIKIRIIDSDFIMPQLNIPSYLNYPSADLIDIANLDKNKLIDDKDKFGINNTHKE